MMVSPAPDPVQLDVLEGDLKIPQGVDGHAHPAHLPLGHGVIGVIPHLRGKIEGHIQPCLAVGNHQLEPLVGLLGSSESRVLSRGPVPAPKSQGMNAAREREFPGLPQVLGVVKADPLKILGRVHRLHLDPGLENHFLDGILFIFDCMSLLP